MLPSKCYCTDASELLWDGILKSSGNEALPPFPIPEAEEIPGQRRFQERVGKVLNQIAEGLNVCEEGRAFNV